MDASDSHDAFSFKKVGKSYNISKESSSKFKFEDVSTMKEEQRVYDFSNIKQVEYNVDLISLISSGKYKVPGIAKSAKEDGDWLFGPSFDPSVDAGTSDEPKTPPVTFQTGLFSGVLNSFTANTSPALYKFSKHTPSPLSFATSGEKVKKNIWIGQVEQDLGPEFEFKQDSITDIFSNASSDYID